MTSARGIGAGVAALAVLTLLAGCERPPVDTVQRGYRGLGMEQVYNPRNLAEQAGANEVPVVAAALATGGPAARTVFKNVQVLGDVDAASFAGTMAAITQWVAPQEGCNYCHVATDMASDALYTKVVARRMLQMTRHINNDWKTHVAGTGVTCYTCHRGQPVPSAIWFDDPGPLSAQGAAGNHAGKNAPAEQIGQTSLPGDPFSVFLDQPNEIRVISESALPEGNRHSIKQTEWTYALMIHMSKSLGVNCTYCHNSRSFTSWDQSTPQRATAWYGIRLVRDLNTDYLDPLAATLPATRHGPQGDGPKVNCLTCHQGAYKPLYGKSLEKDFPALGGEGAAHPAPVSMEAPQPPAGGATLVAKSH